MLTQAAVQATSIDDMPKRNKDEPISVASSPMLPTFEKRSAGSSEVCSKLHAMCSCYMTVHKLQRL